MESSEAGGFELSVVMPCLNEAETLEITWRGRHAADLPPR